MKFVRTPANTMSVSRRTLIYGVGINDAPYNIGAEVNGKNVFCPLYNQWKAMLQRCYCAKWKAKYPTYAQCNVVPEWLHFSAFLKWADSQEWEGKHLDKDLLIPGNKEYGPTTCLWVHPDINRLLLNSKARRGNLPVGVSQLDNRFLARVSIYGNSISIGMFDTPEQAAEAFNHAKAAHVTQVAGKQTDPTLQAALLRIASSIRSNQYYS